MRRVLVTVLLLLSVTKLYASGWGYKQYADVSLITGKYYDGEALLGVHFKLEDGWKIYDNVQHSLGFPTSVEFIKTNNIASTDVVFPKSTKFLEAEEFITYGYKSEVVLPVRVITEQSGDISAKIKLNYSVLFLLKYRQTAQ